MGATIVSDAAWGGAVGTMTGAASGMILRDDYFVRWTLLGTGTGAFWGAVVGSIKTKHREGPKPIQMKEPEDL